MVISPSTAARLAAAAASRDSIASIASGGGGEEASEYASPSKRMRLSAGSLLRVESEASDLNRCVCVRECVRSEVLGPEQVCACLVGAVRGGYRREAAALLRCCLPASEASPGVARRGSGLGGGWVGG